MAHITIILIPSTLIFHTQFSYRFQVTKFMKNLSMLGGCLILLVEGPGRLSLDYFLRRKN